MRYRRKTAAVQYLELIVSIGGDLDAGVAFEWPEDSISLSHFHLNRHLDETRHFQQSRSNKNFFLDKTRFALKILVKSIVLKIGYLVEL